MKITFLGIVYLLIGLAIAVNRGYNAANASHFLTLLLAIFLWPIMLIFGWHPAITLS